MNEDSFADARLLVARAQHHIDELESGIKGFFANDPWTIIIEPNAKETEYVYKFRLLKLFDPNLKMVAADAANNLRSALDHVASQCALLNGARKITSIHFPFRPTAVELDRAIADKSLKDVPPDVLTYFRALNPHKGGDDRLYALTKISARNKHWSIAPVFTTGHAISILHTDGTKWVVGTPNWPTSLEEDLELITSPKLDENCKFTVLVTIRFDEIEGMERGHPVATLRDLPSAINDVINDCEAICQRLGLL